MPIKLLLFGEIILTFLFSVKPVRTTRDLPLNKEKPTDNFANIWQQPTPQPINNDAALTDAGVGDRSQIVQAMRLSMTGAATIALYGTEDEKLVMRKLADLLNALLRVPNLNETSSINDGQGRSTPAENPVEASSVIRAHQRRVEQSSGLTVRRQRTRAVWANPLFVREVVDYELHMLLMSTLSGNLQPPETFREYMDRVIMPRHGPGTSSGWSAGTIRNSRYILKEHLLTDAEMTPAERQQLKRPRTYSVTSTKLRYLHALDRLYAQMLQEGAVQDRDGLRQRFHAMIIAHEKEQISHDHHDDHVCVIDE